MLRPTAIEVSALNDYKILIKFDNEEKKIFDVSKLFSRKPFISLKDKSIFNTAHTNGITIEWVNDIDICPDELYYESVPYFSSSKNIDLLII